MARSERQKLKLLYLRDYLLRNTDEQHPVSVRRDGRGRIMKKTQKAGKK